MTPSGIVEWCSARPHAWISALVVAAVIVNGLWRRRWLTLQEAGDLVISFAGLIGGVAVLKDAFSKTEAEMRGLAWPIVIGGIATVWISGRNAWDRLQKSGSPAPLPAPTPAPAPAPAPVQP